MLRYTKNNSHELRVSGKLNGDSHSVRVEMDHIEPCMYIGQQAPCLMMTPLTIPQARRLAKKILTMCDAYSS